MRREIGFRSIIALLLLFSSLAGAENQDTSQNINPTGMAFRSEVIAATERYHHLKNEDQANLYLPIVMKYLNTKMSFPKAVGILKEAGFDITVLGNGFYEAYPATGTPARGSLVSGTFGYKQGFLSGNILGIHLSPISEGDFSQIKNIEVSVGTVSP